MSIIHGSWIVNAGQDYFFVWGQAWRSLVNETFALNKTGDFIHPFNLKRGELLDLFDSHELDVANLLEQSKWHTQLVGMPTIVSGTVDSKKVQPVFAGNAVKGESKLDPVSLGSQRVSSNCERNHRFIADIIPGFATVKY